MGNFKHDIKYDVPLIPQREPHTCWAASAGMVKSWRDRQSFDPVKWARDHGDDVTRGTGRSRSFETFGLVTERAQTFTPNGMATLLRRHGPIVANTLENGRSAHTRVITGMHGDGTPKGTFLHINDPVDPAFGRSYPVNPGRQYEESFADFTRKQHELSTAFPRLEPFVAHLP